MNWEGGANNKCVNFLHCIRWSTGEVELIHTHRLYLLNYFDDAIPGTNARMYNQ